MAGWLPRWTGDWAAECGLVGQRVPHGGRYGQLRLDPIEVLEGDWPPPLGFAMMEFPSTEQARGCYHSPAYAPLPAQEVFQQLPMVLRTTTEG